MTKKKYFKKLNYQLLVYGILNKTLIWIFILLSYFKILNSNNLIEIKISLLTLFLSIIIVRSQNLSKIEGYVYDRDLCTPIEYVIVKVNDKIIFTDSTGYWRINNVASKTIVISSYFGYETDSLKLNSEVSSLINIYLRRKISDLEEIEVYGNKKRVYPIYKYKYPLNSVPATPGNLISYIYEKFDKKRLEIKKYNNIIKDEINLDLIKDKLFKYKNILSINEYELEKLAYYIQKQYPVLIEYSDVEFIAEVKNVYQKFKNVPK